MKTMSAREAKNSFGLMIDTARAGPAPIEKHGRGVVVALAVEEYERLKAIEAGRMVELAQERNAGDASFDYADAEQGRIETVKEKGFYILPSHLFANVRQRVRRVANLNETLSRVFKDIEGSVIGADSEDDFTTRKAELRTAIDVIVADLEGSEA
jgi:prevent-host-death family protein